MNQRELPVLDSTIGQVEISTTTALSLQMCVQGAQSCRLVLQPRPALERAGLGNRTLAVGKRSLSNVLRMALLAISSDRHTEASAVCKTTAKPRVDQVVVTLVTGSLFWNLRGCHARSQLTESETGSRRHAKL